MKDRKLRIGPAEAARVRTNFCLDVRSASTAQTPKELHSRAIRATVFCQGAS